MSTLDQRLLELHLQRGRLLERIGAQRTALAHQLAPVHQVLHTVEGAMRIIRLAVDYLLAHPKTISTALLLTLLARPRGMWRWVQRGLLTWRYWQVARAVAVKLF